MRGRCGFFFSLSFRADFRGLLVAGFREIDNHFSSRFFTGQDFVWFWGYIEV